MSTNATLQPELELARAHGVRLIAGVDEVGRGALAGPVTVGVAVIDLDALSGQALDDGVWPVLDGVRDSKLLSPTARTRWHPAICEHTTQWSVQHRSPEQIDAEGITASLGAAGRAGLQAVEAAMGRELDLVILDGVHDWLTAGASPRVHTMAKADEKCLTVACASVLAKVERDSLMTDLAAEHPDYAWDSNKGYGSAVHREAIRAGGATLHHRRSWNLGLDALPGL